MQRFGRKETRRATRPAHGRLSTSLLRCRDAGRQEVCGQGRAAVTAPHRNGWAAVSTHASRSEATRRLAMCGLFLVAYDRWLLPSLRVMASRPNRSSLKDEAPVSTGAGEEEQEEQEEQEQEQEEQEQEKQEEQETGAGTGT